MTFAEIWHRIKNYLQYQISAKDLHSIHSPFLFEFVKFCFDKSNHYYAFDELSSIRKKLLASNQIIEYTDIGAKSFVLSNKVKVSDITRVSVSPAKYSELYFRIIQFLNAKICLELGTSIGMNTLYLSYANPEKVITIEGQKEIFNFANHLFTNYSRKNIESIHSNFDVILPELIKKYTFDFVLIDGNHTYNATIRYYKWLLSSMNKKSIIIIDDIYWSKEMTRAWKEIQNDGVNKITLDLYRCGIIIFNPDILYAQHFRLRY
ncbi:MAG TPA: class I SAM-dependent methyltransferase [Bacteroidia bacterium]|nr:class I SAM-dependent methyltransferase [Bacteroidia bacterium]